MYGQGSRRSPLSRATESILLLGLLAGTFALRAISPDQPIVENYVGRQVPTAMVARNLERGSGFGRPQLETLPAPNLFLIEPPVYAAAVVGFRRTFQLDLDPSGRLVSALGITLGAWGLFGLARRREGRGAALLAILAFATFPVTIRYGRSFQPDALMLGTLVAGLRCWDEHVTLGSGFRSRVWLVSGVVLIATGLAVKVIAAYILWPLVTLIRPPERRVRLWLALGLLLPALAWYIHAAVLVRAGEGSRASADNGMIWVRSMAPLALLDHRTWVEIGRFLLYRGFTPVGLALGVRGLRNADRFWRVWGVSASIALAFLAAKLHHEYYGLALAPVAAVGVGRSLAVMTRRRPMQGVVAACLLVGVSLLEARSTWKTPDEWTTLPEAAQAVRDTVPAGSWVVAPEALLYAADRRGCRLEYAPSAAHRATGEWGKSLRDEGPLALVEFYRRQGARYVAIPISPAVAAEPARRLVREAILRRYNVLVDWPSVLIAALEPSRHGEIPSRWPNPTLRVARSREDQRP